MRYMYIMAKRFSLILLLIFISCLFGCNNKVPDCFDDLKPNSEIQLNSSEFPLTISAFVNWRNLADLQDLIADSDLIAICQVDSVYPTEQSPLLYYWQDNYFDLKQYIYCFVSCYDLTLCEVLKGNHSSGEKIKFTYPTDNKTLSWPSFLGDPDKRMTTGQNYLLFAKCMENSFTDAEHSFTNLKYSIYSVDNNAILPINPFLPDDPFLPNDPLKGTTLSELRTLVSDSDTPIQGKTIDDFYSDPLNYMTELTDICCYQSETQLINTSDDIIMGKVVKSEEFSGKISFFTLEESEVSGQMLTVDIKENIKGTHKAGQKIKIFVRSDEEKDSFLADKYEKGIEAVFFLSCMDSLQSCHLMNGELQASIVLNNDIVYNRANYTEKAQSIGFINVDWSLRNYPVYRILFSDCYTKEQLVEKIKGCIVELPDRISYGEYLKKD